MIHFDVDAAEVGKIRKAEIPVVGPLKPALKLLAARSARSRRTARVRTAWLAQLAEWRAAFPYRYRRAATC